MELQKKEKWNGCPEEANQPPEARSAAGPLEGVRAQRRHLSELRRAGPFAPRLSEMRPVSRQAGPTRSGGLNQRRSAKMIALDAMGGDLTPAATVEGALRAHRERGLRVLLVGDEPRRKAELRRLGAGGDELRVQHASEVVEMNDHPGQALRRKKDSSIRVCFDLCKAGEAAGMISAGNSGAVLAGALFVLGRLDHVDRPCIGGSLPTLGGNGRAGLVGRGANGDCTPLQIGQFALMGEVYARRVLGVARPRVGEVANGEEEGKGTELTRAVATALRKPERTVHFAGYV